MPTIKEIIKEYLEKNGYDGLCSDSECACSTDNLMPCDEPGIYCEAGYKGACTCGEQHDFHIYGDKVDALAADEEKAGQEV